MYKIVGFRPVDYENKDGKRVRGMDLHCLTHKKNVEGDAIEKIYVSQYAAEQSGIDGFEIGDFIDVLYNKYGSIAEIKILEA